MQETFDSNPSAGEMGKKGAFWYVFSGKKIRAWFDSIVNLIIGCEVKSVRCGS